MYCTQLSATDISEFIEPGCYPAELEEKYKNLYDIHVSSDISHFFRLYTCGFYPRVILDVGANIGEWSTNLKKHLWKNSYYFLVEANRDLEYKLKETGLKYEFSLVGNEAKDVVYYKTKFGDGTGNSIFKEDSSHYDFKGEGSKDVLRM